MSFHEVFTPGGFSRQKHIQSKIPFSVCTMWRRVNQGTFPRPQKLSENITAWRNDDLNQWFADQSKKFDEVEP